MASTVARTSSINSAAASRSPANAQTAILQAEPEREQTERARLARKLEVPCRDRLPGVVVPEIGRGVTCQPHPAELVLA